MFQSDSGPLEECRPNQANLGDLLSPWKVISFRSSTDTGSVVMKRECHLLLSRGWSDGRPHLPSEGLTASAAGGPHPALSPFRNHLTRRDAPTKSHPKSRPSPPAATSNGRSLWETKWLAISTQHPLHPCPSRQQPFVWGLI